ncbi:hypothetical protein JCM17846_20410 [Iodidimonas nitroreducens]|uniref:Uncharacterized protein n=1 Tax=Iodidimonas nitroreducens TaxID=1236968 RepID=A0A5A7NBD6_9PROT|nr:hypothetical protein JCM17846_20410 [Iodidimonas nitroreducens]
MQIGGEAWVVIDLERLRSFAADIAENFFNPQADIKDPAIHFHLIGDIAGKAGGGMPVIDEACTGIEQAIA